MTTWTTKKSLKNTITFYNKRKWLLLLGWQSLFSSLLYFILLPILLSSQLFLPLVSPTFAPWLIWRTLLTTLISLNLKNSIKALKNISVNFNNIIISLWPWAYFHLIKPKTTLWYNHALFTHNLENFMILVYSVIFSAIQMAIITISSALLKIDDLFEFQFFRNFPISTVIGEFSLGVCLWYMILNYYAH